MKRQTPPQDWRGDKPVHPGRKSPKKRAPQATVALEDSATRPSRKSTRGSSNRIKSAHPKARTEQLATHAPSARAKSRRF
jgi:hypothetical protein